jgi:hypothetical protein
MYMVDTWYGTGLILGMVLMYMVDGVKISLKQLSVFNILLSFNNYNNNCIHKDH